MSRLIDADALETHEQIESLGNGMYEYVQVVYKNDIDAAPTIESERKNGRWEMLQIPITPPVYKCSVCGSHAPLILTGCLVNRRYEANLTKFCPNCGARLEEKE